MKEVEGLTIAIKIETRDGGKGVRGASHLNNIVIHAVICVIFLNVLCSLFRANGTDCACYHPYYFLVQKWNFLDFFDGTQPTILSRMKPMLGFIRRSLSDN